MVQWAYFLDSVYNRPEQNKSRFGSGPSHLQVLMGWFRVKPARLTSLSNGKPRER